MGRTEKKRSSRKAKEVSGKLYFIVRKGTDEIARVNPFFKFEEAEKFIKGKKSLEIKELYHG